MKTIKITTVGDTLSGSRNLLMAFERPDFQYIYPFHDPCVIESFRRELLIDREKIDVDMLHAPVIVCLIYLYIKIDLNCI